MCETVDEYDNVTRTKSIVTVSDSELIEMHCYDWVAGNYEMRNRTIVNLKKKTPVFECKRADAL